jgi:hypothetical protein
MALLILIAALGVGTPFRLATAALTFCLFSEQQRASHAPRAHLAVPMVLSHHLARASALLVVLGLQKR